MKIRLMAAFLLGGFLAASDLRAAAQAKPAAAAIEKDVLVYAERYFPFDPAPKFTVEKTSEALPGFQGYKVRRTGRYEKLKVDRVVFVSRDAKWFFAGETLKKKETAPMVNEADLSWLETQLNGLFRTRVRVARAPERDAAGLKGVTASVETGYGPVRIPGYVSADGKTFFQGPFWNFQEDPRAERRRKIELSAARAEGPANAAVTIVEYADMECGYCKFRGMQLDRLLEANRGAVSVRRHYKFYPLWIGHAWAMKAASAADCIFRLGGAPAMFRFKEMVYSRQETLSVAGIDELALTASEGLGVRSADFLACYLQEESFTRVRREIDEGRRLEVNSTPTYFVDGTEISWIEDKVMEDFLRTKFPNLKGISYGTASR